MSYHMINRHTLKLAAQKKKLKKGKPHVSSQMTLSIVVKCFDPFDKI